MSATHLHLGRGFTLVELLVVIGIMAIIIAILLPALSAARREGYRAKCLSNMRNMAMAQFMYCNENHGWLVTGGLGHGTEATQEEITWFNTLSRYYNNKLVARCPADESLAWDVPIMAVDGPRLRRTSYGINGFLDHNFCPWGPAFSEVPANGLYKKIEEIRHSSQVVQFLEIAYAGDFSAADHTHPDLFTNKGRSPVAAIPALMGQQVQINSHGPRTRSADWSNTSNYTFIDGHAESCQVREVMTDVYTNDFDPASPQPRP